MPEEIDPEFGSAERKFGDDFFGKPDPDIRDDRDFIEKARLEEAIRNAKPRAFEDGLGIQGPQGFPKRTQDEPRRTDFGPGSVARHPRAEITQQTVEGGIEADSVDLYGALNGQPALYHLLQSAAPTPIT